MHRVHHTDIVVAGEAVDLFSQESLNLRMNAELYDPSEISTTQGDYSFEFEIPASPRNCRLFGFANVFDKSAKFMRSYPCQIVADGITVFDGTLRLSGSTEDSFRCNLVQVRKADLEKIFGDSVMSDITWNVPFTGAGSMSAANNDMSGDYYFPLACYGAWQKVPKETYTIGTGDYTDIRTLDKATTRLYWESFPPSMRMNALVRRLFEYKGYTVHGKAFEDEMLNSIYLSASMTDKQDPYYPVGDPSIGRLEVDCSSMSMTFYADTAENRTKPTNLVRNKQTLTYPADRCTLSGLNGGQTYYNFESAYVYDLWSQNGFDDGHGSYCSVGTTGNKYMWRDGCIYIPASGYYKVQLYCQMRIAESSAGDADTGYYCERYNPDGTKYMRQGGDNPWLAAGMRMNFDWCPMEVQIVRNGESVELCRRTDPELWLDLTGMSDDMYPHEQGREKENANGLRSSVAKSGRNGAVSNGVNSSPTVDQWYTYGRAGTMAYDPYVNPNFVIGVSTGQKGGAVIKNGKSWNARCTDVNSSRYTCAGYNRVRVTDSNFGVDTTSWVNTTTDFVTEYNRNTLSTPYGDYYNADTDNKNVYSRNSAVVWLDKGDVLRLKVVTKVQVRKICTSGTSCAEDDMMRGEMDMAWYCHPRFIIEALTPEKDVYGNPSATAPLDPAKKGFGRDLNIAQWLSNEQKMADFVKNYVEMFNLRVSISGTDVTIDTQKLDVGRRRAAVDLTERIYIKEAENSRIEYPKSLQVQFDIADDEAGFYSSVPADKIDLDDWKEYGERGSEPVVMNPDADGDPEAVEGKFSYTWYDTFQVDLTRPVDGGTQSTTVGLRLPLIAKDEHFIIQNEDAMQHDGMSLRQRMWFRQKPYTMNDWGGLTTPFEVTLWNGTVLDVSIPTNEKDGMSLDYYDREGSLLRRYFNISAHLAGNQVKVETYLSPDEYKAIRDGADVIVGGALHIVCSIEAYDPTGCNPTELTLLRTA